MENTALFVAITALTGFGALFGRLLRLSREVRELRAIVDRLSP